MTRAELAQLPTPPATPTYIPIPHVAVVEALIGSLRLRHIGVVSEEFAVSRDGLEMFGVLDLETTLDGCRFAIEIRNANNKRFRLSCTVGLRVFVGENLAFQGDYTPVLAKHSKNFSLQDSLSIGIGRLGHLSLRRLSTGMIALTILMVVDIFMFGEKMRIAYLPDAFGWQGKIVLVLIGTLICVGWFLVA